MGPSRDILGRLVSSRDVQVGFSRVIMCVGDYSLVLTWDFSVDMVGVNSVVVVGSILSSCGVLAPGLAVL